MKQGKGYQSFAKRMQWAQQKPSSNNTRENSMHGHHQMVNTEIRLYSLQPKMEKIYTVSKNKTYTSQQKQDLEMTMAQIMNYLFQNSDLN